MPLTTVTADLIDTIAPSQIQRAGATAGQVLTYNGSTNTWVASAAPSVGAAKAWVNFDGTRNAAGATDSTATARFLRASFNVDSVVRRSTTTGIYTVNFTPGTFSSTPIIMSVTSSDNASDSPTWLMQTKADSCAAIGIDANSCRFEHWTNETDGSPPQYATLIVYA